MASRGRPRKPTQLLVIKNTISTTRHADRVGEPVSGGRPVPPQPLCEREGELWAQFVDSAPWLGFHDGPKSYMWVCLHAEFERDPAGMIAARVAQLRALGSELGLDPSSRSRFGGSTPAEKDPYFD
jgi:hypothetical protein